MHCPELGELPPAPAGRSGWPWTQASRSAPPRMPQGEQWPRVSVIMPSFNQARFLEAALRSILLQGYPDVELFVFDGGSTDGSVEIIKKYARWITRWVSEPDGGQSAVINDGFQRATGLFATWINSDDMLCQDALTAHATRIGFDSAVVYVGDCVYIDQHGETDHVHRGRVRTFEDLIRIRTIWRARDRGNIDQPAVLFPRELAVRVGGVNPDNHRTMDYELWGRFLLAGARFEYTHIPFGMFRVHELQKTAQGWATTQSLVAAAARLVADATHVPDAVRAELLDDLYAHEREYWRGTGRLARLGLPQRVVLALRGLQAAVMQRR